MLTTQIIYSLFVYQNQISIYYYYYYYHVQDLGHGYTMIGFLTNGIRGIQISFTSRCRCIFLPFECCKQPIVVFFLVTNLDYTDFDLLHQ